MIAGTDESCNYDRRGEDRRSGTERRSKVTGRVPDRRACCVDSGRAPAVDGMRDLLARDDQKADHLVPDGKLRWNWIVAELWAERTDQELAHPLRRRSAREWMAEAIGFLGAVMILTAVYWAWEPLPIDRMISDPIAINSTLRIGDELHVQWNYDLLRQCPSHFERTLDGQGRRWYLASIPGGNSDLGEQLFVSSINLPPDLVPGTYTLSTTGFFDCNPVFPIVRRYPGVVFDVVE